MVAPMNRRQFVQSTSALVAGLAASAKSIAADEPAAEEKPPIIPVVMAPRKDGVEIIWRVGSYKKGHVEYGETEELGSVQRNNGWGLRPAGDMAIRVKLDGLKPGTKYFYRIVTESFSPKSPKTSKGEIRSFKTLDPDQKETSFTVWNDTHQQAETLKKLTEITPASDFLLWNGDICNDWRSEKEIVETLLAPEGLDFTKDSPLCMVRGNHDLRGSVAAQLQDYAAMPEDKPWFAFRSGPIAVICMDTGEDKPDDHPYLFGRVACEPMREEQAEWLAEIIEKPEFKDAPFRLVFCHIPLRWTDESTDKGYDHFSKRSRDLWHESLVKWGTQAIISGHTHRPTLIPANKDFPYAQLVGGGPKLSQATLIQGTAKGNKLSLISKDLEGNTKHEISFKGLS